MVIMVTCCWKAINRSAGLNIQAIDKVILDTQHHTEKAIKSFSDDMQWEFIISYLFLYMYVQGSAVAQW